MRRCRFLKGAKPIYETSPCLEAPWRFRNLRPERDGWSAQTILYEADGLTPINE